MPDRPDLRPIQVFLDTKRFIEMEEPQPFGGGAKDFFQGNDFVRFEDTGGLGQRHQGWRVGGGRGADHGTFLNWKSVGRRLQSFYRSK